MKKAVSRLEARIANAELRIGTAVENLSLYAERLSTQKQELKTQIAEAERFASRIDALEKQAADAAPVDKTSDNVLNLRMSDVEYRLKRKEENFGRRIANIKDQLRTQARNVEDTVARMERLEAHFSDTDRTIYLARDVEKCAADMERSAERLSTRIVEAEGLFSRMQAEMEALRALNHDVLRKV